MDIHPPERPILSLKEFLVHIGTVTIGILIALSLEGLLEQNHHGRLVREARENIRAEMEDNQREISGQLAGIPKNRSDHQTVLKWIGEVEKDRKSSVKSISLNFSRADLDSTSWTTAQALGALGLMPYAEVKRDAAVYQLQDEFMRLQNRAEDAAISAMILFTANPSDPEKSSAGELQDERNRVANSMTALLAQEQIGKELQKRYAALLRNK